MRAQSLTQLALNVRQMIDADGQQNAFGQNANSYITDTEMVTRINEAVASLWDLLTSKFGENYSFRTLMLAPISGVYSYDLPADFLNLLSVDVPIGSNNGTQWASVMPYNVHERNIYAYATPIVTPYGFANLRYQLQGSQLNFIPSSGQLPGNFRVQYTPCAPYLCATLPVAWTMSTPVTAGTLFSANVTNDQGIVTNQTFVALTTGTTGSTIPAFNVPGTTQDNNVQWAYQAPTSLFATTFDGISGWEKMVVLDAAIYFGLKMEEDVSGFQMQMSQLNQRIEWAAANRQAGDPRTLTGGFGGIEGGGGGFGGFGSGFGGGM
jgi:hypothetical protein